MHRRRPMRELVLLLAAAAGCGRAARGDSDPPPPAPPAPVRAENPAMVRFHMQQHFGDLREVERLLVSGKLDVAKTRAFLLTKPAKDPGLAPWSTELGRVVEAARRLVAAPDLTTACHREAEVALACAECHARTQQRVMFPEPPPVPADEPTERTRMARHQWATDRLWEGLVSGSVGPWRQGLDVLAATPLPYTPGTLAPKYARQLQAAASKGIAQLEDQRETLASRAQLYGDMLVTCASCHATLGPALAPVDER